MKKKKAKTKNFLKGPYLAAAFLCEKVLIEKDNVFSIVRIVDRIKIRSTEFDNMPPGEIGLTAFIAFKAGSAKGKYTLKIKPEGPNFRLQEYAQHINFEGKEENKGSNFVININTVVDKEGLYWFNLFLNDKFISRMPLKIVYERVKAG